MCLFIFETMPQVLFLLVQVRLKEHALLNSDYANFSKPFHDGGRYHTENNSFLCGANQWTGFYMITASVMKGLSLSTSNKNFEITNYSLERSFQKE